MSDNIEVTTTLRRRVPIETRRLAEIKDAVLGKKYTLSVVFIGNKRSNTLNKTYRKKDKPTNVLSFPLSDTEGEIFITLPIAEREAKHAKISVKEQILDIFIHGTLHLKGRRHGRTMEAEEQRLKQRFQIHQ